MSESKDLDVVFGKVQPVSKSVRYMFVWCQDKTMPRTSVNSVLTGQILNVL